MGYETRPGYQFDQVSLLMREGFGDARIGALTGIPRWTVRDWRQKGRPGLRRGTPVLDCPQCGGITSDEPSYAYLLGLYLGDGCISRHPRTHRLRIVLDARVVSRQVVEFRLRHPRSSRDLSEQLLGVLTSFECVHLRH
jgi:hypothetical protein